MTPIVHRDSVLGSTLNIDTFLSDNDHYGRYWQATEKASGAKRYVYFDAKI